MANEESLLGNSGSLGNENNQKKNSDHQQTISHRSASQEIFGIHHNNLLLSDNANVINNPSIPKYSPTEETPKNPGLITNIPNQPEVKLTNISLDTSITAFSEKNLINNSLDSNNSDVKFVKITSIEYAGEEQVYDIEVEGTHNFVANGIVAHNTYISGNTGIGTTNPSSFKLEVAGNIGPEANGTRDLGSSSRYFNAIYANNVYGSGALGYWNRSGTVLSPATAGDIVNIGDGTVALPAYSFTNDTDTGMYRITTDKLGFATGATARMVIDATGQVGIGTTGPGAKLDVNGDVLMSGGQQDYKFTSAANDALLLQGQTSGTYSVLDIFAKDGDATDGVGFTIFGKGTPSALTNTESVAIAHPRIIYPSPAQIRRFGAAAAPEAAALNAYKTLLGVGR